MNLVVTKNVTVPGTRPVELTTGQVLTDADQARFPKGKIRSMRQIRILVPESEAYKYVGEPTHAEPEAAAPSGNRRPDNTAGKALDDKLATPVGKLGLKKAWVKAYTAIGLTTVKHLLDFGREHGTLTKVDGIGEEGERETQEAITRLLA